MDSEPYWSVPIWDVERIHLTDCPILKVAISPKADILLTDDKDFLESGVNVLKVKMPSEFINMC